MVDKTYYMFDQEVDSYTMEELRQRRGLDEDDMSEDEDILAMSGFEFLDEWLNWQGIIGYTGQIVDVIRMAYGIDLTDYPFIETIKRTAEEL